MSELEHFCLLELDARGGVAFAEDDTTGRKQPQSVTLPLPGRDDHVAVLRTPPQVETIMVYADGSDTVAGDARTLAYDRGVYSEFWIDADALARADTIHFDTVGGDLDEPEVAIDYRGWTARLRKPLRELGLRLRTRLARRRGKRFDGGDADG